jgi:hypothetical protein
MTSEDKQLFQAVLEINNTVSGLVTGVVAGSGIFVATLWLVVKGGPEVGPHLSLLNQFFPGYSVTYFGTIVGFIYGFVVGYLIGWSTAWLYNRFAHLRSRYRRV